MKPMLACDADLNKIIFPIMGFPKIDGVRALIVEGKLVGRSGKQFKNKLNNKIFSHEALNGLDGEMVVHSLVGNKLCSETSSALSTIEGEIQTRLCIFDYVVEGINDEARYYERYGCLKDRVRNIKLEMDGMGQRLWIIPFTMLNTITEVEEFELACLESGFEGVILRDPEAPYKHGRATQKEASYLRLKQFLDSEIVISEVKEGKSNQNELLSDPHGHAERSTHATNMIPNGMVGTICGHAINHITDKKGNVLIEKGHYVEIGAGKLSHDDRKFFFENQDKIIGRIAKFQFFPIGIKDKLRFPTFQSFRSATDM